MSDNQSLQIQLLKGLYARYQQEIISVDGVYLKAQFNGLSDLIKLEIKEKPFSSKMLMADLLFINRTLEISNNVNENIINKDILNKLQQALNVLGDITAFFLNNPKLNEQIINHLNYIESAKYGNIEIKSNRIFRKIELVCANEIDSAKVIEEYNLALIELHKKITQSNKAFLLDIVRTQNIEPRVAVIKILLGKIISDPKGSLILLKVFKA